MITIITPGVIAEATPESIKPDLTKFDKAKEQVGLVVAELKKFTIIETKETLDLAMSTLKIASEVGKAIENKRKDLVAPWNGGATDINAYVKELIKEVEPAMTIVKNAVLEYNKAEAKKVKMAMVTARQGQLAALGFVYNGDANNFTREKIGTVSMTEVENYEDKTWNAVMANYADAITKHLESMKQNVMEEKDLVEAFGDDEQKEDISKKLEEVAAPRPVFRSSPSITNVHDTVKGLTKRWTFEILDSNQIPREYLIVDETAIRKAINAGVRTIPGVSIFQSESLTIR